MMAALLLVNTVPILKTVTFEQLRFSFRIIPVHTITLTPLFSAYLYLFLAAGLTARLFRLNRQQVVKVIHAGFRKGWRASLSMALFGAMGQIIAYSGYSDNFLNLDQTLHIPYLLSEGLKQYTGSFYPVFVPVLGWVGTFLTGYGVASLMLFGQLQIQAAGLLGVSPAWL